MLNFKNVVGKGCGLFKGITSRETEETTTKLNGNSLCQLRDLNQVPREARYC